MMRRCVAGGRALLAFRIFMVCASIALFSSCGLPPLVLLEDNSVPIAPSGPSVAAVLANIKCELWQAANDESELPYYLDLPGLPYHRPSQHPAPDREFTLKNLFSEIEFVSELKLTLEVTDSGALNPSANFIHPLVPSTNNLTLAVGGQAYSSSDRIFDLYQSVDFERLVQTPEHPLFRHGFRIGQYVFKLHKREPGQALPLYAEDGGEWSLCDQGVGLHGRLGLREDLATSAIAARMQDVAVLLSSGGTGSGTVYGQTPQLSGFNGYAFGEMDTTINFTISVDVNAGPNWTLAKFKGPNVTSEGGGNGSGLANVSRLSKDSLSLTVIPVCIRPKYFPEQWEPCGYHPNQKECLKPSGLKPLASSNPSFNGTVDGHVQGSALSAKMSVSALTPPRNQLPPITFPEDYYDPEMGFGTPVWANYLPPCLSPEGQAALAAAPAAAKTNLQLQGIDNLLRNQRRD